MQRMFNNIAIKFGVIVLSNFLLSGASFSGKTLHSVAWAQDLNSIQKAPANREVTPATPPLLPSLPLPGEQRKTAIAIRNVKASYVAWMLDPGHNAEPVEVQMSRRTQDELFRLGLAPAFQEKLQTPLPEGTERIIAVDPMNIVLVVGTDAATNTLKERIENLDKPLPQVVLELRVVRIKPQDAKTLASEAVNAKNLTVKTEAGDIQVQTVSLSKLLPLVNEGKAQLVTAPRLVGIEGLWASIGTQAAKGEPVGLKAAPEVRGSTGFRFVTTPTVNKDETTTVSLVVAKTLQLSQANERGAFPLQVLDKLTTELNLNDGETLMLTGDEERFAELTSGLTGGIKFKETDNVVLMVTASLLRRFGDTRPVPGT